MRRLITLLLVTFAVTAHAQTWTRIPSMLRARAEAAAVQLKDGNILVVGGRDDRNVFADCELFDPRTNTWTITGNLNQPRYRHDVQLLPSGEVIAIGGLVDLGTGTTATCELYDPVTKSWQYTEDLPEAAENIYAKMLPDGRLLASGGLNANVPRYIDFAVIYDPAAHRWTRLPNMLLALDGHNILYSTAKRMTVVASGLYGGANGTFLKKTQILRDGATAWEYGAPSAEVHDNTQLMTIQMPDETPVLCGGRVSTSSVGTTVEAYDFLSEKWSTIGTLVRPHWHCWAFRVGQDSIILVGGAIDPGPLQSVTAACTWFDYGRRQSTAAPTMLEARNIYAATKVILPLEDPCIHTEAIYVFGGQDASSRALRTCEKLELGVRADPAIVQLAPRAIDSIHVCHTYDTILTLTSTSCQTIFIDSVVCGDTSFSVTTTGLPIAVDADSTVRIPIRLDIRSTKIYTAIKVVLRTAAGHEVRWIPVTGSLELQGAVTLTAADPSARSICASQVDSVALLNTTCDSATIESITFTGADAARFVATGVGEGAGSDGRATVHYTLDALDPRTYTATMVVITNSNGHRDTLRQALAVSATGGNAILGRTVMTDRRVKSGDTVQVPLKLVTTAKSQAQGAEIDLEYDKDLLELLPPDFDGTLADGSDDYDINLTPRGARIYLPGAMRIENGTIANLRFRTFVTKKSCTTVKLSTLLFSPDDPKFSACILSTNLDSAIICLDPQCGDNEIRDFLNGKSPQVSATEQDGVIRLQMTGWGSPEIAVFDELGNRLPVEFDAHYRANSSLFGSGAYYFRVSENGITRTARLSIRR